MQVHARDDIHVLVAGAAKRARRIVAYQVSA
jgi:hypothetical protein